MSHTPFLFAVVLCAWITTLNIVLMEPGTLRTVVEVSVSIIYLSLSYGISRLR